MGRRQSAGEDDPGSRVQDRVLAFARERGLTVRPVTSSSDLVTVELPKGELLMSVTFENTPKVLGRGHWFVTARDPRTSEQLWSDRFDYDMWMDFFGDASKDTSDEEWAQGADNQLIAFLDAVITSEVRLAGVERKPLVRFLGWRWPTGERTELQLLTAGEWHVWNEPGRVFLDE